MASITVGEFLYDYNIRFTNVTEYGVSMASLLAGEAPPAQGARFDVAFEGTISGPKLKGKVAGVDYLSIRADGRGQLHIHGEITTEDGERISLFADGVTIPEEGTGLLQIRENVTLTATSPAYSWVNPLQIWAPGTLDPSKGEVNLKAYTA